MGRMIAAAAIGTTILLRPGYAMAAEPTPQQIEACTPDALRFCPLQALAAQFGNREPVRACMIRNWKQVSKPCKEAFRAN